MEEDAQIKIDVFFAVGRITEDEYIELTSLIEEVYGSTTQ